MRRKIGLMILTLLVFMSVPVYAKSQNGFYADNNLELKKEIGTTTFAAGNIVDVSSNIDGLAFVAGNNVTVSSTQDYLFVAGNSIIVKDVEAKDAFIAGTNINISHSQIRDLYVAGASITVDSDIERNAYLGADTVTINSVIEGNVNVSCEKLIIGDEAIITGTLSYPEEAEVSIPQTADIANIKKYKGTVKVDTKTVVVSGIGDIIASLCSIILVGLLLLFIYPRLYKKIDSKEKTFDCVLKNFGIGFVTLCVVPIACLIFLFTVVGLPISIITMLLYGVFIYLSVIPTSYYFGKWILKDKIKNNYFLYILAITILIVLKHIPFIGGLVSFISLCIGLGFFVTILLEDLKQAREEK